MAWSELVAKLELEVEECPDIAEARLNELIQLSLSQDVRQSCTTDQLNIILRLTQRYIKAVSDDPISSETKIPLTLLTLTIKLLRNLCAGVQCNQLLIGQAPFVEALKKVIICSSMKTPLSVACVQLLGNICVSNDYGQQLVWHQCYPSVFCSIFSEGSDAVRDVCCMVMLNCIMDNSERLNELTTSGGEMVMMTLRSLKNCQESSDWMVMLLEKLVECVPLQVLCDVLSPYPEEKIALLEFLLAYSDNDKEATMDSAVIKTLDSFLLFLSSGSNLLYLKDLYKELVARLITTDESVLTSLYDSAAGNELEQIQESVRMFVSVLKLVCNCSCYMSFLRNLQNDGSVLQCTIDSLHALSKLDGSLVSGKNRSHSSNDDKVMSGHHPLYGVKRDLVRLIGNLCYKCKSNQDMVHDFIPLILNQCSIDHSNPYIMQWALWAIRNVCEENPANQAVIGKLEQRGEVNADELRRHIGASCEVEVDENGKLRLKRTSRPD